MCKQLRPYVQGTHVAPISLLLFMFLLLVPDKVVQSCVVSIDCVSVRVQPLGVIMYATGGLCCLLRLVAIEQSGQLHLRHVALRQRVGPASRMLYNVSEGLVLQSLHQRSDVFIAVAYNYNPVHTIFNMAFI